MTLIAANERKSIPSLGFDSLIAVFQSPGKVLKCAYDIQSTFLETSSLQDNSKEDIFFTMGISVGQPLTENTGFFEKAIQSRKRLCLIAGNKEIITSKLFRELCDTSDSFQNFTPIRTVNSSELHFLDSFLDITEEKLSDYAFGVDYLSREIGISRPQLYCKITAITGRSPVSFIRDIRLKKALSLIKEHKFNISEIALEVGYNSSFYFSQCFQKKYGVQPSKVGI